MVPIDPLAHGLIRVTALIASHDIRKVTVSIASVVVALIVKLKQYHIRTKE